MHKLSALLLTLLVALGMAFAQTAANTSITNQASASYIDSAGQPRTTTSNEVVTVVQQVYNFTITPNGSEAAPGQTRSALPGAQVYFSYVVSNSGNGTDTINLGLANGTSDNFDYSGSVVYRDDDCDGTVDNGEVVVTSVTLSRAGTVGSSVCVVVASTIPAAAANTEFGNLNLVGTSAGSGATDSDNFARGVATTTAALDVTKSASPVGTVSPGATITYTISGQNRGGSAASGVAVSGLSGAGILVSDIIPSGLVVTYSGSNPSGSAGAGTVQMVYSTDGSTWAVWSGAPAALTGNGTVRVGMYIQGAGAFFPQTASYTFSFAAAVPAGAAQGTSYVNQASLAYSNGTPQNPSSNSTTNTVGAVYGVAVGPTAAPTAVGAADSQTAPGPVYSGSTVSFVNTLRNTGNTADSFTLGVSGAPAGWVCGLYQTDGTTPISGPVGPFPAGGDFSFQVRCQIPASYAGGPNPLTVTATSLGGGGSDTTTDVVPAVVSGYAVDLATDGATGAPVGNDNPVTFTDLAGAPDGDNATNPGTTIYYPLDVLNAGSNPDTYNLSATLPSGWTVTYYQDTNGDGNLDPGEPVVSSTGLLPSGAVGNYIAAVQVPAGTAPGSSPLSFTTTSTTLGTVTDTVTTSVTVNLVTGFEFDPDRSGTVTSPGTIDYAHNLRNTGNQVASVTITPPASAFGWTYQISTDGGATWSTTPVTVSGLAANTGTAPVLVRVIVPGGQPIGRVESATFGAVATYTGGGTASDSVTDTTTVVGGDLRLTKRISTGFGTDTLPCTSDDTYVTTSTATPGSVITYCVVAENIGTGVLTNVRVSDPLPAFTSFVSASASTTIPGGTLVYSTDGSTWTTTAPTTLAAGGVVYVAVNTAGAAGGAGSIDAADVMPAGSSITLVFRVQVQ